jgi:phage replication-related protein YjqB (UPF0714/DUF867 family)
MSYKNFAQLAKHERSGIDYRVRVRRAQPAFAVMAFHGGSIEPGTSEIADAIAAEKHSFYTLEGLKPPGKNGVLHITSTEFDEPMCLTVLGHSSVVVTLHGAKDDSGDDDDSGETVFLGGLDDTLCDRIEKAFHGKFHVDRRVGIEGEKTTNICNRGTSGAGVQLELSKSLRKTMFYSLTPEGRKHPTDEFEKFVAAVRGVLDQS